MVSSLTDATKWAQQEFKNAKLSDQRLTNRLVKVATALANSPVGTLPSAIKDVKDIKAAYRFFSNNEVTHEQIMRPHIEQTRDSSNQPGEYLLPSDTTELDFSTHFAAEGIGRIGNDGGRGVLVHTTLAVKIARWDENLPILDVLGICAQDAWARTAPPRRGKETSAQRLQRERESQKWTKGFANATYPPAGVRWTFVADRESDVYEVFNQCQAHGIDFIIRATQRRALIGSDKSIFQEVEQAPVCGCYQLSLRARPGQRARTANIEMRSTRVTIRAPWRPDGPQAPVQLNVLLAQEINAPGSVKPIHWILLTSWDCTTFDDARKVTAAYAARWLVEEYHKALKTGTQIEKSQLATYGRLTSLLGVLSIIAVRMLRLKFLIELAPDQPLEQDDQTGHILELLEIRGYRPKEGWTNRSLLIAVAKLGGFMGRKRDGNPGWITLWRGVKELLTMSQTYEAIKSRLLKDLQKCGE